MTILPKSATTDFTSTTLNGSINNAVTTITVNSATNIQTPTYAIIDREDVAGTPTPNAREVVYISSKSGNDLSVTRGVNNSTARSHNSGALMEFGPTVGLWSDLYSWATAEHTASDGTHDMTKIAMLSGATIQTLASKILSSATVVTPTITVPIITLGSDAQGDIYYRGSGATLARLGAGTSGQFLKTQGAAANPIWADISSDGWVSDTSHTWTYASASTFTIAGVDLTGTFTKGTRLRFKQGGGYKYAVVTTSAFSTDTTVTIAVNTDYTIANSSITDNYYSYAVNPQGFPTYFNSTSMVLIGSGGSAGTYAQTTNTSKFAVQGGVCTIWCVLTITNKGSWSGSVYLQLPVIPSATDSLGPIGQIIANGGLNTLKGVTANTSASSGGIIQWNKAMQTQEVGWTDLATTDIVMLTGSYLI